MIFKWVDVVHKSIIYRTRVYDLKNELMEQQ